MTLTDRGLANVFLLFGLMLVLGAMMIAVLEDPVTMLEAEASERCSTTECTTGLGYVNDMWTWAPAWVAGIGFVFVIAGAIFEGRRTRA